MQNAHDSPDVEVNSLLSSSVAVQIGLDFEDVTGAVYPKIKSARIASGHGPLDLAPHAKLTHDLARLREVAARSRRDDRSPGTGLLPAGRGRTVPNRTTVPGRVLNTPALNQPILTERMDMDPSVTLSAKEATPSHSCCVPRT